jgi:hypothetical protein
MIALGRSRYILPAGVQSTLACVTVSHGPELADTDRLAGSIGDRRRSSWCRRDPLLLPRFVTGDGCAAVT